MTYKCRECSGRARSEITFEVREDGDEYEYESDVSCPLCGTRTLVEKI